MDRLAVRVLSSEGAGAGKSLLVCRLSQSLPGLKNNETVMDYLRDMEADVPLCITVPIYGPFVHQNAIAESLLPHTIIPDLPLSRVFHLDVHPSVGEYLIIPNVVVYLNRFVFLYLDGLLSLFHFGKIFTGKKWP